METKNVLKTAGKIALTVACPPLGLGLFTRLGERNAMIPPLIGTVFFSLPLTQIYKDSTISPICDSPKAYTMQVPNHPVRGVLESLLCPIAYVLDGSTVTVIERGHFNGFAGLSFAGDNVISYDKATGKYVVNFNEQVDFGPRGSSINELSSLADVRTNPELSSLKASLEGLTSNGDLINSKNIAKQYDNALARHQEKLEANSIYYDGAEKVLGEVVAKMNSDLVSQRAKLAGNAK